MCTLKRPGLHVHKTGQSPIALYARGNVSSAERPAAAFIKVDWGGRGGTKARHRGNRRGRSTVVRIVALNQDRGCATLMSIDEILEKHPWPSLVDPHSAPCPLYQAKSPSSTRWSIPNSGKSSRRSEGISTQGMLELYLNTTRPARDPEGLSSADLQVEHGVPGSAALPKAEPLRQRSPAGRGRIF